VSEHFEVVVIGSGAGGGVVAGELAHRGRSVLLLEVGPHKTAADHTRWEAKANHDLWWPIRQAPITTEGRGVVLLFGGRCVGGTTTINTKVAFRPHEQDFEKWHAATGLQGEGGEAFGAGDLAPHFDNVEEKLGVRERTDWPACVQTIAAGFRALDAELEPVHSYTDHNCMRCGSCLQGCPTNAGKNTANTYIHPVWATGQLELRPDCEVKRVVIEDRAGGPEAAGVEYVDSAGETHTVDADVVVVAAGALNTPQLMARSGMDDPNIGRNLGLHPARLVYGLFDEIQDAHIVYPITSHCTKFQRDEDGGFVVEACTVQDPIGFAASLEDEGGPLWGPPLVEAARRYRYWNGVLVMANDANNASVTAESDGGESFLADFQPDEFDRIDRGLDFGREVLRAAGAGQVVWTGLVATHVQGSCRMGSDPARSVVDANCEAHTVKRLFVGDASAIPRTLSVNPSLTIMALADRLAAHLHADPSGYLEPAAERVAAGT
jgi:choline dehydrogenase-like flavoprotein